MFTKLNTVCFSGHRSEKLPKSADGLEKLKVKLYDEIEKAVNDGYHIFMTGACYGFDLVAAETVLLFKKVYSLKSEQKISLIAAIPFEEQASRWREEDRESYYNILAQCDEVVTLSVHFTPDCYLKRNRYMVENSSKLICFYDGSTGGTGHTYNYAVKQGLDIENLFNCLL